jgi:hypothetical protein
MLQHSSAGLDDALVTSFLTFFGRALCPNGLDPRCGSGGVDQSVVEEWDDGLEDDIEGGEGGIPTATTTTTSARGGGPDEALLIFYSQAAFGMALGKGMESLVQHLVRTRMPRLKSSSSSSLSGPPALATLHLLHSALPHGCVAAPAPSEPRCAALFRCGRFMHENVILGLNRTLVATCHHNHHHHHPHEEGIATTFKAQVLLEAFHILFLRASSSSSGTGSAVNGLADTAASSSSTCMAILMGVGEEEMNRWVPYLVQNVRDVIPRIATLLFDVIEDTRNETGQALTAPGDVAAAIFGRSGGGGVGGGGGSGGGPLHVAAAAAAAAVPVQLMALLRVLCFWMVACTEHLQGHNRRDDAVAGYRFSEHEELLAYIACRCRVQGVRGRFGGRDGGWWGWGGEV